MAGANRHRLWHPHEWQPAVAGQTPMLTAAVEKIHAVGALTHITLRHDKRNVHVSLSGSDAAKLNLAVGHTLSLVSNQIYVFSQNELIEYSI